MGISGVSYHGSKKGQKIGQMILDFFSGCIRTISSLHSHIHEGKAYQVHKIVDGLANAAKTYIEITTGDDEDLHLKFTQLWISEGPVKFKLIENPTLTTGTTAFVPINRNRKTVDGAVLVSDATVKVDPSGISGGNELDAWKFGINGQGSQQNDSETGSQIEWVLEKGGNTYLIEVENISGGAIDLSLKSLWYE